MIESITRSALTVLRRRPGRTVFVVGLMTASGIAEGIGVIALLPALELAGGAKPGTIGRAAARVLEWFSISPTLYAMAGAIAVALLVKAILRWLALSYTARAVVELSADLRQRLVHAVLGANWNHFVGAARGGLVSALDRDALWGAFTYRNACAAISAVAQAIIYGAILFVISWKLGLMMIALSMTATLPLAGWVNVSRRAGVKQTDLTTRLSTQFLDSLEAIKPVKAMGRGVLFEGSLRNDINVLRDAEYRQISAVETLRSFQEPILAILLLGVVLAALTWAHATVPAIMVGVVLLHRIVSRLQTAQTEVQNTAVSLSALASVESVIANAASARTPTSGDHHLAVLANSLELKDISFRYGNRVVLRDLSLTVKAGEFVAIVGESGSGKTTLLDIIARLRVPSAGVVCADGNALDIISFDSWSRALGYMPQESMLMHATIADNLRLGDEDSEGRLQDCLSQVSNLRLDQLVGEHGLALSGGERRRVALARALVGNPSLLLLDEPTSELDELAAREIALVLHALRGRVTIIAVTHHPAIIEVADTVYRLVDGRLAPPVAPISAFH